MARVSMRAMVRHDERVREHVRHEHLRADPRRKCTNHFAAEMIDVRLGYLVANRSEEM